MSSNGYLLKAASQLNKRVGGQKRALYGMKGAFSINAHSVKRAYVMSAPANEENSAHSFNGAKRFKRLKIIKR